MSFSSRLIYFCDESSPQVLIENAYKQWLMAENRLVIYECHFNLPDYYDSVDLRAAKNWSVSDEWASVNFQIILFN